MTERIEYNGYLTGHAYIPTLPDKPTGRTVAECLACPCADCLYPDPEGVTHCTKEKAGRCIIDTTDYSISVNRCAPEELELRRQDHARDYPDPS